MFDGVGRRQDATKGLLVNIGQHSLNGYERNCLFRNNGDGTFTDVAYVNDADRVEDGRGLSVFDYDGDGQQDLLMRNYRQPAELLRNLGRGGHWIELTLVGVRSNRDAVGARIALRTVRGWQTREVSAGAGYLSGQSLVQHFGLGRDIRVIELQILWPSGEAAKLRDLPGDRRYTIVEGAENPRDCPRRRIVLCARAVAAHHHRILVVEDDIELRDALGQLLEAEGYLVEFALDGGEALDRLEVPEPPCLILLDLMMPRVDGWQFRAAQVRNPKMAAIPVIVCSGAGNVGEKAASLGIPSYLQKPLDPDALLALVRRYCEEREADPAELN